MGAQLLPVDLVSEIEFFLEPVEDPIKRAVFAPRSEAIMRGPPLAVSVGQVSLRAPGPRNTKEAACDLLVVLLRTPVSTDLRQQVLNLFKLFVGELKASASHPETGNR